jgi:hypothetical protein
MLFDEAECTVLMGYPSPLPDRCRGHGKRKRVAVMIVFCPARPSLPPCLRASRTSGASTIMLMFNKQG